MQQPNSAQQNYFNPTQNPMFTPPVNDMAGPKNPQDSIPGGGGDAKMQKTKLLDKIEMMGSDILRTTTESIDAIEDIKVKLHADNL